MAKARELGDPDDSDDSVSLTSTGSSEKVVDYEVECILAERRNPNGVVEYLTAWKNYPETSHSWEPRQNFNDVDTFNEWRTTRMRVAKGLEKPFDVKAWEKRCKTILRETGLRRERRRAQKLRLIRQGKLASALGRQEADIEGLDLAPAPKPSNKRIKRRSVHHDSPPSSSASVYSSSSTEDSDRPLISRQESEIVTPNSKWTETETIALEEGLRKLKGPFWTELLSLYGQGGKINQVLSEKTRSDLYDKTKSVYQEFLDSGREPPEYLKPFAKPTSSTGSRTATPKTHSDSICESIAVSKKSSRSVSTDSIMAGFREKQWIRQAKDRENCRPQPKDTLIATLKVPRGREKESQPAQKMSGDEPQAPQASKVPARKEEMVFADETLKQMTQTTQGKPHSQEAAPHSKNKIEATENSDDYLHRNRQIEGGSRVEELPQMNDMPRLGSEPESQTSGENDLANSTAVAASTVPENDQIVDGEIARPTWSGTARVQTARPLASGLSRRAGVGSGLIRPSPTKPKPKLGQIEPKKPTTTGDVTARWNAEPKKRKSNNWATQNAEPVEGQSTKPKYKLSVQNRIYKSRREGGTPNPHHLVFIDPKTGKAPKTIPARSATPIRSKTSLQLHQDKVNAREPQESQAQDLQDTLVVDTSEPDPPPQRIDQDEDVITNKRTPSQTKNLLLNASISTLRPTTGDMAEGPPDSGTLTSPSPVSPHRSLPSNTPLGPRIETKKIGAMSLQEYTQRSKPFTHHFNEALSKSHQPQSSDEYSMFTLRAYPSLEQRDQLFNTEEHSVAMGDIKLGKDDRESIKVRLVGFENEVRRLLLTIKIQPQTVNFVFETACLASEYQTYFSVESSDYLGSGSVIPYHKSASALEDIIEALANNMQGGLFFAENFTMLIYPAGASAWLFLDKNLPRVRPGTALRFVLRRPLPQPPKNIHGRAITRLINKDPKRYEKIAAHIKKTPIQAEDKNVNIVFRDMFEIDFDRLVAQNGPQQHPPTNIFFLCFIPQGCEKYEPDAAKRSDLRMRTSEEHDLFIKFLHANGAEEIYSLQSYGSREIDNNGAWDYFCKNVKSGTIIFHDAFIRYDLVPHLGKHLLHGSVNVWKTSLSPMHGEKHPHLVRLFPHGGVLLLTESLMLYRPRETLRILMWFRRVQVPGKAPGTWKLAVRPRVREWLLDIIEAYTDSGKDIFGCSKQIFGDIYTEIYELLQDPDPSYDRLMCHEWDYEIPTDEAPIVSSSSLRVLQARKEWRGEGADTEPDDDHIKQNDDTLAQWFAEWATANLHTFRKYHIILGYAKDNPFTATAIAAYEKGWGHIEVMTSEEACVRHKVTPQSKLDDMEADRRRKQKEQLPAKKAANAKARKEAREAAKLALELRMQLFRDAGATEEQVLSAGRLLLRELGGSEKEVEECKVDMKRAFVERWWEDREDVKMTTQQ